MNKYREMHHEALQDMKSRLIKYHIIRDVFEGKNIGHMLSQNNGIHRNVQIKMWP